MPVIDASVAKSIEHGAPHSPRRSLRQRVERCVTERFWKACAPRVRAADLVINRLRDTARAITIRRRDLIHVHPVQQRLGNRVCLIRRRDPDHIAGVDRYFSEFIDETLRRIVFSSAYNAPSGSYWASPVALSISSTVITGLA